MKIRNIVLCAQFAALMCICAWIAIPIGTATVTLQVFALFLSLGLLGGKRGSLVCALYLLLGAVGLPVFSGFQGGIGVLFGINGGYLIGFLAASLTYWAVTALPGKRFPMQILASVCAILVCYSFAVAWSLWVWHPPGTQGGLRAALLLYVVPYVLPDAAKLTLALLLTARLKPMLPQ